MIIKKIKNGYGSHNINLIDGNKMLSMWFCGNLDLYWTIYDAEKSIYDSTLEFMITKETYRLYELFDILYNRIKDCQVYKVDNMSIQNCRTMKELQNYLKRIKSANESLLINERKNPERLFKYNVVEWHCDEDSYKEGNVLKIIRHDEDSYLIRIEQRSKNLFNKGSIRFRSKCSKYQPFNSLFMDMFNELQSYNVDDPQIYIEEAIYRRKLEK